MIGGNQAGSMSAGWSRMEEVMRRCLSSSSERDSDRVGGLSESEVWYPWCPVPCGSHAAESLRIWGPPSFGRGPAPECPLMSPCDAKKTLICSRRATTLRFS